MASITITDLMLLGYFAISGVYVATKVGKWLTRLVILRFICNEKDIEDLGWKLFELCDLKHGGLQPAEAYTITTKAYTLTVKRLPPPVKPKRTPAP